jgi:hypothetical protein
MQLISLKKMSQTSKVVILKELGYGEEEGFVINSNGEKVMDRYLNIPINIENMVIFPGSEIILDDNELSISAYLEEFGDVF